MTIFKSNIKSVLLPVFGIYIILLFIAFLTWHEVVMKIALPITVIYLFFVYVFVGLTNHDIVVNQHSIEIINRVFGFRKRREFNQSDIRCILLKHDWTEAPIVQQKFIKYLLREWIFSFLVPLYFYKWVEVETANGKSRFYCFGIENEYEEPDFEELYIELIAMGYTTKWTNESALYPGLKERVKQRLTRGN